MLQTLTASVRRVRALAPVAGNDRHVIKATKEISMQHLILLAVVSMMVLYVLIIAGCLCYVGRHGRRTS